MDVLQGRFVTQSLRSEGEKMLSRQGAAMRLSLHSHTGQLLSSRSISVTENTLTFRHSAVERFLDLKRLNRGSKEVKRPAKRKIHNRFIFSAYGSIARRLMYGYTEEVMSDLRKTLGQENL